MPAVPPAVEPVRIAPSILAADFAAMGQAVRAAEEAGADAIHVDVMDGSFVPEISFGRQMVVALRAHTRLPLDVHLMVVEPQCHIRPFAEAGADTVTIHVEAMPDLNVLRSTLEEIRGAGAKAGLALKPATAEDAVSAVWDLLDHVLVMTVEPGYSGQKFQPKQLRKVTALARRVAESGRPVRVAVDGGVDERTAPECVRAGAHFLVAGSSVYSPRRSIADGIRVLRAAVGAA
jgi:ribulose-phosphate 3-epimerase